MAVAVRDNAFGGMGVRFGLMSNQQKLGLMFGIAAIIALLAGSWMWSQTPDYRVLYGGMSDRDGGAVIASLQQMNIPYKMADGGGAILVPSGQVYEVRLRLASQGLPKGNVTGFELMDGQKLGMSQFQEQVNYQRALEGEITRSIQSLSAVQGARVHLAIPRQTVFVREQQKPSASVLLSLYPGKALDPSQVSGIVHLISSSVPNLPVNNVTIVDQSGNMLSAAGDGSRGRSGLDPSQLDYLHEVEQSYVKRIEAILAPILGKDNVKAQVAADLDFSTIEQTAETFKPNPVPNDAAIRSQQVNETMGDAAKTPSGVPGALSNQPPGAASAPISASGAPAGGTGISAGNSGPGAHKESTTNFEVDKTIQHIKQPVGAIKRLSVAVVVNNRKAAGKDAKGGGKPLPAAEVAQLQNLVKQAMGFNQVRGDSLNIVNAAFSEGELVEVPASPIWKDPETLALAKELGKNLIIAALLFYLVFGIIRPILKDVAQSVHTAQDKAQQDEADIDEGGVVHKISHEAAERAAQAANYEENLKAAKELAKQDPRVVASVVKDWVDGE
ncbi:MAG: flagellar basal-body MS-ring/collar protein FliF [Sulfuricellaceae bacterium]|nr:flagellar basal-body MS-ring/collar protein FliF [Sulfuricellaceae bacterium]